MVSIHGCSWALGTGGDYPGIVYIVHIGRKACVSAASPNSYLFIVNEHQVLQLATVVAGVLLGAASTTFLS
jgi:hypothetical protein